jgi:hypothetical protein
VDPKLTFTLLVTQDVFCCSGSFTSGAYSKEWSVLTCSISLKAPVLLTQILAVSSCHSPPPI